jgi:hypothetical protein
MSNCSFPHYSRPPGSWDQRSASISTLRRCAQARGSSPACGSTRAGNPLKNRSSRHHPESAPAAKPRAEGVVHPSESGQGMHIYRASVQPRPQTRAPPVHNVSLKCDGRMEFLISPVENSPPQPPEMLFRSSGRSGAPRRPWPDVLGGAEAGAVKKWRRPPAPPALASSATWTAPQK